mmetsp:Transcript_28704/g.80803  ORF Transcript_28704/g.80803 Transcript_28704/m.80803 type:complete len:222 (+) Transcript_28704:260-925(+)
MPRLLTEKEPPTNSSGFSLFSRARPARSFTSAEICCRVFELAPFTIGVMRPPGVATATEMSAAGCCTAEAVLASHVVLTSGTSISASATARITKSLTETLVPCSFSVFLMAVTSSSGTSMRMYIAGMVVFDSRRREAITRRICVMGMSTYSAGSSDAGGAAAGGEAGEGFAGAAAAFFFSDTEGFRPPPAAAARASPLVTSPRGPVPATLEGRMPARPRIS